MLSNKFVCFIISNSEITLFYFQLMQVRQEKGNLKSRSMKEKCQIMYRL